MSVHRYTSRGRTRQPKNLALNFHPGTEGQPITFVHFKDSGSVDMVADASNLSETLASTTAGENGYNTENQDYLHLALSQSTAAARTVNIYAYNRCFGTWGLLKVPANYGAATLDTLYVDATINSDDSSVKYLTIPIHGIDRVGFVCDTTTGLTLYAAGSTF